MIYKKCYKCMQEYEYGKQCPCSNREHKKSKLIKGQDDGFYALDKWIKLRAQKLEEYNGTCQRCLVKKGKVVTKNPEGHHLKPRNKYPELELDPDNIVIICKPCNLELGDSGIIDWDRSKEIRQKIDYVL